MTDTPTTAQEEPSFEQRLEELEAVVETLESGDLPLEAMLSRYEHGMQLVTACQQRLAEAEMRVTEIAANRDDASGL